MPTSKFRICKILVFSGFLWLLIIFILDFHWENVIERESNDRLRNVKNPQEDFFDSHRERMEMIEALKISKDKNSEEPINADRVNNIAERLQKIQEMLLERQGDENFENEMYKEVMEIENAINENPDFRIETGNGSEDERMKKLQEIIKGSNNDEEENKIPIEINSPEVLLPGNNVQLIQHPVEEENPSETNELPVENEILNNPPKKLNSYKDFITTISPEVIAQLGLTGSRGEQGSGVYVHDPPPEVQKKIEEGWAAHQFNEFVSDLISVNRTVPDPRSPYCSTLAQDYSTNLPKTSVIIIFHNEAWSTLLRSVHSVLNRSPDHLIEEVILVDDFSHMPHLKEPLEDYFSNFPKVKILRAPEREGLIKARIRGTNAAKGPVLTFLDSHIECTEGWLEPLLDRIAKDKTNVVCPVIDVINDDSLAFSWQGAEGLQIGGFKWELTFTWVSIPQRERDRKKHAAEPTRSPTMAGGLFSIDKEFFVKLGLYDPGFDIWGAENLEISFKTWMCGGTLEIIPCSHVGHIFRKKSPYTWRPGVNVLLKNGARLAEVWLDDYKKYFFMRHGGNPDFGDVSERVELRKNLQCKSFKWFIDNIYPEMEIPNNIGAGYIKNNASNYCLDFPYVAGNMRQALGVYICHNLGGNQYLEFTKAGGIGRSQRCLEHTANGELVFVPCNNYQPLQKWTYNETTYQIYHESSAKCLSYKLNAFLRPSEPLMEPCDVNSDKQKWNFQFLM